MKGKFLAAITLAMSLLLTGCGGGDKPAEDKTAAGAETTLKIGATPAPHAEILEQIKPDLKEQGISLEIIEFNDYVQPNIALNDKELDANFFQHEPYLNDFVKEHTDVKLKNAGGVHVEPMGIYSSKIKSLD